MTSGTFHFSKGADTMVYMDESSGGVNLVLPSPSNVSSIHKNFEDKVTEELQHLEGRLKQEYNTLGSWLPRLPWLDKDPLENFFVDMTLQELDRSGRYVTDSDLKYQNLFCRAAETRSPKRILLVGEGGFGKTTLVAKVAQDWAREEPGSFNRFQVVLIVRLRDLRRKADLEMFVLDAFRKYLTNDQEGLTIKDVLRPVLNQTLFLLDGYEELNERQQTFVRRFLSRSSFFLPTTVLLTTRSGYDKSFLRLFDRHVKLCALSRSSREKLVDLTFAENKHKASSLKQDLNHMQFDFLDELSPLLFFAICFVMKDSDFMIVGTTQALIINVIRLSLRRTATKLDMDLSAQDLESVCSNLGQFFLAKLLQKVYVFTLDDIKDAFQNQYELIIKLEIVQPKDNNEYVLINKLFMDTLACVYLNSSFLATMDQEERLGILKSVLGNPDSILPYVLLKTYRPEMALSGHFEEMVYCVFDGKSILHGKFMLRQDFNHFISAHQTFSQMKTVSRFRFIHLCLFKAKLMTKWILRDQNENTILKSIMVKTPWNFGVLTFKFNERLYCNMLLRKHNIKHFNVLLESLYDRNTFKKMIDFNWNIRIDVNTDYSDCSLAEIRILKQ